MRKVDARKICATGRDTAAKDSRVDPQSRWFWLLKGVFRQGHIAAAIRAAFLCSLWSGAPAIHAQDLPILDTLPVSVVAGKFVDAGNRQQFTLIGLTADKGFLPANSTPTDMTLKSVTSPSRSANESRFTLFAMVKDDVKTFMMVNLVATTRRCLSTAIDPVLDQANESGRVIEVSSTLMRLPPFLAKVGNPVTLCTMDSGKLALYFSAPGFDMVQLTAVSYGTPTKVLRPMSTQSVMLYFPIGKL